MTSHRLHNLLHSLALLASLVALLWLLGWFFAGPYGILWAMIIGIIPFIMSLRSHPRLVLRMYGARPLSPDEAPQLYSMVGELSRRAGLTFLPSLHYIPSRAVALFTVGHGERAVIVISIGMLRLLTLRELAAVLSHEIGHLYHNDTWVMSFADVVRSVTFTLSLLGQLLILVNLPLIYLNGYVIPWLPIILMLVAPLLSALLQLALSRTREFNADLLAARITADPDGLASALAKIEESQQTILSGRRFFPGHGGPAPSLLRTHPATSERIRRLREIEASLQEREARLYHDHNGRSSDSPGLEEPSSRPRLRWHGLWH